MPRPRTIEKIEITGNISIPAKKFLVGFKGTIEPDGRIKQTLGSEYAGYEVEIYVRKPKKQHKNEE